jgi:uncharacterized protein (TIGR02453 family)
MFHRLSTPNTALGFHSANPLTFDSFIRYLGSMPRYFSNKTFAFLKDLDANNDRDWFKANKDRYEADVREPSLDFIEDFADRLVKISPHFVADARKQGGSLFRIHRDTRFSKDKTPYKTHSGMQFRHVATKDDVHAPGFYLHIEPGECWAGIGLWQPATADALKIRQAIVDDPTGWKKAAYAKRFTDTFELSDGNKLQRPPKGFDPEHSFIEDLKRRDFTAAARLSQKQVTSEDFLDDYTTMCKTASPFLAFLSKAIGISF